VAATAALVNLDAAARWALEQERDVTVLCAGERRAFSLEDAVCAGMLVDRLLGAAGAVEISDAALAALRLGEHYAERLERIGIESEWGRQLGRQGRAADLDACLRLSTSTVVPVFDKGAIVRGAAAAAPAGERGRP
jgi:2-phosphosulfolactate phosphatase